MWYNFNGKLINEPLFDHTNRSFRYGDGLFESMRVFNGKIFNERAHIDRLKKGLLALKIKMNKPLGVLFLEIEELLHINNLDKGAYARLMIYRDASGGYLPNTHQASYFIEVGEAFSNQFELANSAIKISFYEEHKKHSGTLSNLKSNNALIYILAAIYAKEEKVDDALLLNEKNKVIESTNANLFILDKDGSLITPPLSDGCLEGTMRSFVMNHFQVKEQSLTKQDVQKSKEVILSNANGLRWTGEKRMCNEIINTLNALI
jgi:branched-chain amino acid aminotransferase